MHNSTIKHTALQVLIFDVRPRSGFCCPTPSGSGGAAWRLACCSAFVKRKRHTALAFLQGPGHNLRQRRSVPRHLAPVHPTVERPFPMHRRRAVIDINRIVLCLHEVDACALRGRARRRHSADTISITWLMAIDNRDWFIEKLRRRLNYKERAAFRVNLGEQRRDHQARQMRLGWLKLLAFIILVAGLCAAAIWVLKHILSGI